MVATVGQLTRAAPEEVQFHRPLTQSLVSKSQRGNMSWGGKDRRNFPKDCYRRSYKEDCKGTIGLWTSAPGVPQPCSLTSLHTPTLSRCPCHGLSPTPVPASLLQIPLRHSSCLCLALWVILKASSPGGQTTSQGHWVRTCNTQPL